MEKYHMPLMVNIKLSTNYYKLLLKDKIEG